MSPKPKSLIPDAMVVIRLHELGLWDDFCSHVSVVVPSIVVHESRFYIAAPTAERVEINLEAQALAGHILEAAASVDEMDAFMRQFDAVTTENLHDGEIEALTLLFNNRVGECWLCSADRAAVKALVLAGMKDKGISLERAFHEMGLVGARRLGQQYSQKRFEQWTEEAALDRMQGRGLVRWPF